MAPLPITPSSPAEVSSNEISIAIDTSRLASLLSTFSHRAESLFKRDLGPSQSQSVGMAIGLSVAGVIVAIFLFGWVRYAAARQHKIEAERRRGATEKPAEEAPPE